MARGYPDYFGQSIWPKYGTPLQSFWAVVFIAPTVTQEVLRIDAQGVLTSATFYIQLLGGTTGHNFTIVIDGEIFAAVTATELLDGYDTNNGSCYFEVTYYSVDDQYAIIRLIKDIPFRSYLALSVTNMNTAGGANIKTGGYTTHYVVN